MADPELTRAAVLELLLLVCTGQMAAALVEALDLMPATAQAVVVTLEAAVVIGPSLEASAPRLKVP